MRTLNPEVRLILIGDVPESALDRGKYTFMMSPGRIPRSNSDSTGLDTNGYAPTVPIGTGGVVVLHSSSDDTAAISNTTTETAFSEASVTVPGGTLEEGDTIWLRCYGRMSGLSMTNSLLTLRLRAGGTLLRAIAQLNVTGGGFKYFQFAVAINVRGVGATGNLASMVLHGEFQQSPVAKTNRAETTLNTLIDQEFTFTGQWATASASNAVDLSYFEWTLDKTAA